MKIGVLGSGTVAQTLAAGFSKHGHQVMAGTEHKEKLQSWSAENASIAVGSFSETAAFGEVLILAVKGLAAAAVLRQAQAANLSGKVVMDATNPIADAPPENGVLRFFTSFEESLMERLQQEFPDAQLVKAFGGVGAYDFIDPVFAEGKPTMFICGNDAAAKQTVANLLAEVGWETRRYGKRCFCEGD